MIKEKILVTREVRRWLEETFGVRREMVSAALNYRSNTELAQKIRTLALKKGGKHFPDKEMATIHNAHGQMIQTWGSRIRLVADKETGDVTVYVDGEEREHHEKMKVAQLMSLQARMGLLAASL